MATDLIRYDLLVQNALRGVVRKVLTDAAREGVPGEHHFYVSFLTAAQGVRISNRLREKYPDEMTIVLQHQFWDLGVTEHSFEVGLAFGGIPERLLVPFEAVTGFFDPSVQFALKFEASAGEEAEEPGSASTDGATREDGRDGAKGSGKREKPADTAPALVPALTAAPALAAPALLLPKRGPQTGAGIVEKPAKGKGARAAETASEGKIGSKTPDPSSASADKSDDKPEKPAGAEVLSLDAFRKKS